MQIKNSRNLYSIFTFALCFLALTFSTNAQSTKKESLSKLDIQIKNGFDLLKTKRWSKAQSEFEQALKIYEKQPSTSSIILSEVPIIEDVETIVSTNGVKKNMSEEINQYRKVMGTRQALYQILANVSQLANNDQKAESYFDKIYELRSLFWGESWTFLIPKIETFFAKNISLEDTENFGKYQYRSGRLLLSVADMDGISKLQKAKELLPRDANIPASIASYLVYNGNPQKASEEAKLSLKLKPNQLSVLIDLATAELLLGNYDDARKYALQAKSIDSDKPGVYATLAFVALEKNENKDALEQATKGNQLSNGHSFYKTILAVCLEANGESVKANQLMKEAWGEDSPNEETLKKWFFRGKALENAKKLLN